MAGVSDKQLLPLGPFPAGVDNLHAEDSLQRSVDGKSVIALRDSVNFDWDKDGWPTRREGRGQLLATTRGHSLWHGGHFPYLLFADGATQFAVSPGNDPIEVKPGLSPRNPISYCIPNDKVYCTNNQLTWCVLPNGETAPWGVESPAHQPTLTIDTGAGGLDGGRYQVAQTFIDFFGEESGTGLAAEIVVPDKGGIVLSNIAQPVATNIRAARIYLSGANAANGDHLYFARDVPIGQTTALLGGNTRRTVELATQLLRPMPAGHIVRELAGRLYVATGNVQTWSEVLRYGLTQPALNRRLVGDRIDLMECVGDGGDGPGIYMADQKRTYWLGGADPNAQTIRPVYQAGAIRGTGQMIAAEKFGYETTQPCAYWIASDGQPLLGLPGGQIVKIKPTDGPPIAVSPRADQGASLFMERDGIRKIMTTLSGGLSPQGLAVRDRATARVYRNDVEIDADGNPIA